MASEIRVNKIINRSGLSTVTFSDTGAIVSGIVTANSFSGNVTGNVTGSGANLTSIPAGQLTGTVADARLTSVTASKLSGALPALDGSALTGINTAFGSGTSVNTSGIITATAFIPTTGQLSHRNKVINGAMNVAQRNMPITSANGYCLDMFKLWDGMDSGVATVDQSTHSPDGFSKSFKVDVTTADTSLAATDYARIHHRIEAQNLQDLAYGTSEAKNIVISFYVRSTTTGTYVFSIEQSDNSNKHCVFNYTVNSANTWERKTFSIAGDTAGVINDDNGYGFTMYWILAAGSNYSSGSTRSTWTAKVAADSMAGQSVNLFSNTSNEFFLTGVQLEVGSVVTPFEHRSYAEELQRCQRYYYEIAPAVAEALIGDSLNYDSSDHCTLRFPVEMRVEPSFICSNFSNAFRIYGTSGGRNVSTLTVNTGVGSTKSILIECAGGTNGSRNFMRLYNANSGVYATIAASAEL